MGDKLQSLLKQLRKLQDLLGDLNDAVVVLQMIEVKQPKRSVKHDAAYLQHQQKLIQSLRAKVPHALKKVIGTESRGMFGQALAQL